MPKRKIEELGNGVSVEEPRRSSRRIPTVKEELPQKKPAKPVKLAAPSQSSKGKPKKPSNAAAAKTEAIDEEIPKRKGSNVVKPKTPPAKSTSSDFPTGRRYWLMKAEPETRIEKGHDIRFSIDDLASKTEPEPWDGIRNYQARNNLRAMSKGDLAFFYHSSCKVPAIVGTMEIVQEHSPDLSAHDSKKPYYDPSSTDENPKWSVVHVKFRQKLKVPVTLKELKAWQGEKGHPLEKMQVMTAARLSVSKVSAEEWEFLVGEMKKRGDEIVQ